MSKIYIAHDAPKATAGLEKGVESCAEAAF